MDTHELRGCSIRRSSILTTILFIIRASSSIVRCRRPQRRTPNNQGFLIISVVHPVTGSTDTKRFVELLEDRIVGQ